MAKASLFWSHSSIETKSKNEVEGLTGEAGRSFSISVGVKVGLSARRSTT